LEDQKKKEGRRRAEEKGRKARDRQETLKKETDKKGAGGKVSAAAAILAHALPRRVFLESFRQNHGKAVASARYLRQGRFCLGYRRYPAGNRGLKSGGSGGVGRKGAAESDSAPVMGAALGAEAVSRALTILSAACLAVEGESSLSLKKRGNLTVSEPKFVKGGALDRRQKQGEYHARRHAEPCRSAIRLQQASCAKKPGLKGRLPASSLLTEFRKSIFCQVASNPV